MGDSGFGERMAAARREQGISPPGRKPIAEKFKRQIGATERAFATAMPAEAERYVDELAPKEPETCPAHGRVLSCTFHGCTYQSERTAYNHRAASYVFDRIMGKPTARTENTITVRLVQELVTEFITIFGTVNAIADPQSRQAAFADQCEELGVRYGGNTP